MSDEVDTVFGKQVVNSKKTRFFIMLRAARIPRDLVTLRFLDESLMVGQALNWVIAFTFCKSQTRAVPSSLPATRNRWLQLKTALRIGPVCPRSSAWGCPPKKPSDFQMRTMLSS